MISVCIATYNGETYIREQIASILPQLSAEDEVIVSDDASTDTTIHILVGFNDKRITVLLKFLCERTGTKYTVIAQSVNTEST